ncbi:polyprenol monophosphomannose synthase [Cellulomonas triticagri]|uniref:Polyprenol monophosphomannose synthase n=1 Tax=Cellulomonas triticagri TaxID=2483352 RepID=A0A3M2JCB0_9CELL|nr:polyprenol monophosphomannose synthase [Cellulomonas triticagri]RMI09480.1 polyprenol monophosphomannose synthase [Cellulomonas triticagri]
MTADRPGAPGQGARVLVVVPTYDERASLPRALAALREHVPDADVLVVDDASPDGTGALAEDLAARDADERGRRAFHVLHRAGKQGLGTAYVAGFRWALERGYDVVVEMDADGSHRAEDLPRLLARVPDAELVIGSRWVRGGRVVNWPLHRQLLSRGANVYAWIAMGLPVRDATAGFRAYRASTLGDLALDTVASHGYCFQIDMAWRVLGVGGRVVEVPITFVERAEGRSKMSRSIVVEALVKVTVWGAHHRVQQVRSLARRLRRG